MMVLHTFTLHIEPVMDGKFRICIIQYITLKQGYAAITPATQDRKSLFEFITLATLIESMLCCCCCCFF